jgi:RHS repeat-associated protein
VTVFHYSLNGQIIAESNSAGTITAEYVYLNGQPLAKMEGANTYYYHNDHLGTPQKMTDSTGTVVWSADYKPFGEATVTVSTITNNLRFPGQYFDAETGNNYNLNRHYNPTGGRYIEADPIGLDGGINPFIYVRNNPLRWIDPEGLQVSIIITAGTWYGHTAIQVGNTVYSNGRYDPTSLSSYGMSGNNIMTTWSYNNYIQHYQSQGRSSTVYVLNLSASQQALLQAYFQNLMNNGTPSPYGTQLPSNYTFTGNNCTTTAVNGLQSVMPWYNNMWINSFSPYQLQFHLATMPWLVTQTISYPGQQH